ncbi:P-loop containing nucleoside triphosphate hydrolase protein [Rhodotorula diobovata]|uniref:Peroxisomal ATPase PEX1 n=1 Tax=Rhodotorula diobovata TaxID=5288 RepID=A0A5C5FM59_9BASI|nr:P-loop containing nucleoside triphosphate hydrolase protein [Rhodotorula diobovata]
MGRTAAVHLVPLRNCLCNLPLSLHAPLSTRAVAPQSIAVQLTFKPLATKDTPPPQPVSLCLGWTGLPAQPAPVNLSSHRGASQSADRIEIDPQFAAMLHPGLQEGTTASPPAASCGVSIELLRDLPHATQVNVTPLTADDWEVLETNAEFVEMYLLNQVRACTQGMTVGCWVGSTLVRFAVDSTVPAASPAVLLTTSTELVVAPKSRHPAPSASKTHDLSGPSTAQAAPPSSAAQAEWEQVRRTLLRLLPASHPAPSPSSSPSDTAPSSSTVASHAPAQLLVHPSLARKVRRAFPGLGGRISAAHYPRPGPAGPAGRADGGAAAAEDGQAPASPPPGQGTALPPAGAAPGDAHSQGSSAVEVVLVECEGVPVGHVWAGERARGELLGAGASKGDGAFELIRLGAPLTSQAKKARAAAKEREKDKEQAQRSAPGSPTPSSRRSLHQQLDSASSPAATGPAPSPGGPAPPHLAGIDKPLSALSAHVVHSLSARALGTGGASAGAIPGVLVTGASGAGKTALVKEAARRMAKDERALCHTIYVDCAQHADARLPALKGRFKDWLDEACWHAPSVLVLDNLDRLIGVEVEHADSFPTVHLAHTFLSLAQAALAARPIVLAATAQGTTTLHPLLQSTHLLGETVPLRGPDKAARRDIVNVLVAAKTATSDLEAPQLNCASIAAMTEGYLPADLRDLVDRAVQQAAIRSLGSPSSAAGSDTPLILTAEDFAAAQQGFVPLSLRDVKLQKSDVAWADIGGLHEARKTLRETLEWPTKYGAIFAGCPLRLRSGLLLYGFPGCGKTLLASAVAKECGLNFISVKGPEILNKYIGASEKSVRDLFDRAQAAKPCVLFFDEFDSIAPKRGHDSTGVTDRVVNQMLTQMDGAEGLDGVYVLAATSRPDLIDPALLRPGRLDKSILCDMPSRTDRLEILRSAAQKVHLAPGVTLDAYAAQTAGYSGADLQALVYNAHLDAVHAGLNAVEAGAGAGEAGKEQDEDELKYVSLGGGEEGKKVLSRAEQASVNKRLEAIVATLNEAQRATSKAKQAAAAASQGSSSPASRAPTYIEEAHLRKALEGTRPSVPADELVRLRRIYDEFVSGRSANGLPSGEASDEVGGRASLM